MKKPGKTALVLLDETDAAKLCPRCGMRAAHGSSNDCIAGLRAIICNLENEIGRANYTYTPRHKVSAG